MREQNVSLGNMRQHFILNVLTLRKTVKLANNEKNVNSKYQTCLDLNLLC